MKRDRIRRSPPVKPFKKVTFFLIVAPLGMLPGLAEVHPREPPLIEIRPFVGQRWQDAFLGADERQVIGRSVAWWPATGGRHGDGRGRTGVRAGRRWPRRARRGRGWPGDAGGGPPAPGPPRGRPGRARRASADGRRRAGPGAPTRTFRTSLTEGRNRFWKSRSSCQWSAFMAATASRES
jgi:hypothetical protein